MKKVGIVFVCILLILALPLALAQSAADAPKYQVTLLNQEPDPVEPGEVVTLRFQIENVGDSTSQSTDVGIVPQFPLQAFGPATKNIGTLRSAQESDELQVVEFKLRVDPQAVEQDVEVDLRVSTPAGGQSFTFAVDIQTRDAVLAIDEVFTQPATVPPGENAQIMLKLTNLADTILRDIRLDLDFDNEDLPIIPFASSTEKRVAQITSGQSEWVSFGIKVQPEATAQGYKIPLTLTYFDDRGTEYTKETFVGVNVGDEPQLLLQASRSEIFTPGSSGLVTLEVANPGLVDVKLLVLEILDSDDFVLLSPQSIFSIGDVDSDDRETEDIQLYVSKENDGNLEIPVAVEYRDANNKIYSSNQKIILPLYSSGEAKKFGLVKGNNPIGIVIIVLVLAGGGYWWWRKRKKK